MQIADVGPFGHESVLLFLKVVACVLKGIRVRYQCLNFVIKYFFPNSRLLYNSFSLNGSRKIITKKVIKVNEFFG